MLICRKLDIRITEKYNPKLQEEKEWITRILA